MANTYGKVSGTFEEIDNAYGKVSGAWKEADEIYGKVSGVWKLRHNVAMNGVDD
mgnify:CR=1 FL=1